MLWASEHNHVDVVEFLLTDERIDPSCNNNFVLVQSVINNNLSTVELILNHSSINKKDVRHVALLKACKYDYVDMVKLLLRCYDENDKIDDVSLTAAICGCNVKVTKMLLKDKRVPVDNSILDLAIKGKLVEVVKLLLEDNRVDPFYERQTFVLAAMIGNVEIVKLLLDDPRVDPIINSEDFMKLVVIRGKTKAVKLILKDKRVNPASNNNEAIRNAMRVGNLKVVKVLLQDDRVNPVAGLEECTPYGRTMSTTYLQQYLRFLCLDN
jgi:ankyrin repeat protein